MTTIVYKDGIMAADTQMTRGALISTGVSKLSKYENFMWGFCGDMSISLQVSRWVVGNIIAGVPVEEWVVALDTDKAEDFEIIVACKPLDGNVSVYGVTVEGVMFFPNMGMWSTGSGATIGSTAIECGKNAVEAVETAIKFDIYTGGEVHSMSFDSPNTLEVLEPKEKEDGTG